MMDFKSIVNKYKNSIQVARSVPGIYLLVRDNKIVYVGQSVCVESRIAQHRVDKEFDKAYFFECPANEINEVEMILIESLCPEYNKVFNSKYLVIGLRKKGEIALKEQLLKRFQAGYYDKRTVKAFIDCEMLPAELTALSESDKN